MDAAMTEGCLGRNERTVQEETILRISSDVLQKAAKSQDESLGIQSPKLRMM